MDDQGNPNRVFTTKSDPYDYGHGMGTIDFDKINAAEEQVEAFIRIISRRYGVREEEIPAFVEAIRWAIEHRNGLRRISWHAYLGVASAFVAGFALIVWEGFKRMVLR